jgi:hypothetical protein
MVFDTERLLDCQGQMPLKWSPSLTPPGSLYKEIFAPMWTATWSGCGFHRVTGQNF